MSNDQINLLRAFIRAEADNPVHDFYARLSVEISTLARPLSRFGGTLREKWISPDHLAVTLKGFGAPTRRHIIDVTPLDLSAEYQDASTRIIRVLSASPKKAGSLESAQSFFVPEELDTAQNAVMNAMIDGLPDDVRDALFDRIVENDPAFRAEIEPSLISGDHEGNEKRIAVALANRPDAATAAPGYRRG